MYIPECTHNLTVFECRKYTSAIVISVFANFESSFLQRMHKFKMGIYLIWPKKKKLTQ